MSSVGQLPVGTVTFLFTDIEGSTQLLKRLRDDYGPALAEHQRILREVFAQHSGHEIDTQGDSFFVAFRRAKDAVSAAIAGQRRLAEHAWPDDTELRVRMGIHTGEPNVGETRYVGLGVHRAARICAAGHGGQILVSQSARELLRDDPLPDVSMRDLGEHQLKDMDEPERIHQVVAPGLVDEFPPLKTTAPSASADEFVGGAGRAWLLEPRRGVPIAAAAAVAVVLAAIVGLVLTGREGSAAHVVANSVGVIDPRSGRITAGVPVGVAPRGIAVGTDAVWVSNTGENTVSRIDPATNAVRQEIPVGAGPNGIAVGASAVWVANGLDGTLSRIDPTTNTEVQKIPVGNGPSGVAYDAGAVWVTNATDGTVSRISAETDRKTTFPAVVGASGVAAGFGRIWIASPSSASVVALNPSSGQVVSRIAVGNDPSAVAADSSAVWVVNRSDGTITEIDPLSASVRTTFPVGSDPSGVAAGPRGVWVADAGDARIVRIDPGTGHILKTVRLDDAPLGIAESASRVYVAVRSSGLEHRGGELRVLLPSPVTSLDPVLAPFNAAQVAALTNDGLVAFRKVGGIEGTQLVPDLAITLPTPTDGGKAYTFQVRRGVRYSNGKLVEPDDFRRAIERIFEVEAPFGVSISSDYAGIVGADRCRTGRQCDLTRGIVTDRRGRTVTFRLSAPDPDFLAKLAASGAYAIPAGTPARDVGMRPIPATGPYQLAVVDSRAKTLRLVRNPVFREWSADAQPEGYPDAISVSWRLSTDQSSRLRAAERGATDVAEAGDFPPVPKDTLEAMAVRYPSQLHLNTELSTAMFFLNTDVAPFDDLRARRAVNDAFDRDAFARLYGRAFAPTCRILPPGVPGYEPTCPYRSGGVAGVAAARRLIARSGTAGKSVTVWAFGDVAEQSRFMVSVLRSLGYRARLEVVKGSFDRYNLKVADSRTRAQTGYIAWFGQWASAGAFLTPIVSCDAFVPASPAMTTNLSEFCDPSLDAQMARASAAQVQDPPTATVLWQKVERSMLARAPVVPVYNARNVDLVSKRVGNYQYNPASGALLGQLWVR